MAHKILVHVLPSERFYDAVVAAGDLVAREGGSITFLFSSIRPPPFWEEREDVGNQAELETDADIQGAPDGTIERWQDDMRAGLEDALDLLRERGVAADQMSVL